MIAPYSPSEGVDTRLQSPESHSESRPDPKANSFENALSQYLASSDPQQRAAMLDNLIQGIARLKPSEQAVYKDELIRRVPTLAKRELNNLVKAAHQNPSHDSLHDQGNAARLLASHSGDLAYCGELDLIYVWCGTHWVPDKQLVSVSRLSAKVMAEVYQLAVESKDGELQKWALSSQNQSRINSMIEAAKRHRLMRQVTLEQMDTDPWLLNCPSGVVDLRNGESLNHAATKDKLITQQCPTVYRPDAAGQRWEQFITESMVNDKEMVSFIQRFAGLQATGVVHDQLFFIHWGEGANGKSLFFATLSRVLGSDYACTAAEKLLEARRHSGHSTDIMDLKGRRLVYCSESNRGASLDMGRIKSLTGSDPIKAHWMHQDNVSFMPTHKLSLMTNHKPLVNDESQGAWRRLVFVPWLNNVKNPDTDLGRYLIENEAESILAWMVRGAVEYYNMGLELPQTVMQQTKQYQQSQDPLADFIEEKCVLASGDETDPDRTAVRVTELFAAYNDWCDRQKMYGMQRFKRNDFNEQLERRYGLERKAHRLYGREAMKCWMGITLRRDHFQAEGKNLQSLQESSENNLYTQGVHHAAQ